MDKKEQEQIIKDWLSAAKRQVRQTNNKTSVFISFSFHVPVDNIWEAWTDPAKLSLWFTKVMGEIKAGNEIAFDVGGAAQHNF